MRGRRWAWGLCALVGGASAQADVIHLMSGSSQECVVRSVTDAWVTYETDLGAASLPRKKVIGITRDTDAANQKLLKGWQAERAAAEARARARQRQEEVVRLTKRALGLVEDEGEWITPEEQLRRREERQAAQAAAAVLSREEAAAGHHYYYRIWMTPAAYRAVQQQEAELRQHQDRMIELQQEYALLDDQIEGGRLRALQGTGMEDMEARAAEIEKKKEMQVAVGADIRIVRHKGDAVAAGIETLVERARERLRRRLAEQGAPPGALKYLAETS